MASSSGFSNLLVFSFIVFLVISFIGVLFFTPDNPPTPKQRSESFDGTLPADFLVFNYYPKESIKMEAVPAKGEPVVLIDEVGPLKTKSLSRNQVKKYLTPGSIFRFRRVSNGDLISDYIVSENAITEGRLKNLHVGMITTRFIANSMDGLQLATTHANAGGGNAWLIIHNLTSIPLSLNGGEIKVEPHSTFRYLGYLNQGVTLGTYFKDDSGLYPDFQYLRPHNSLYYGVVSDLQQPLLGCLQYGEFNDQCDYGQTLWPFEEGVI